MKRIKQKLDLKDIKNLSRKNLIKILTPVYKEVGVTDFLIVQLANDLMKYFGNGQDKLKPFSYEGSQVKVIIDYYTIGKLMEILENYKELKLDRLINGRWVVHSMYKSIEDVGKFEAEELYDALLESVISIL